MPWNCLNAECASKCFKLRSKMVIWRPCNITSNIIIIIIVVEVVVITVLDVYTFHVSICWLYEHQWIATITHNLIIFNLLIQLETLRASTTLTAHIRRTHSIVMADKLALTECWIDERKQKVHGLIENHYPVSIVHLHFPRQRGILCIAADIQDKEQ